MKKTACVLVWFFGSSVFASTVSVVIPCVPQHAPYLFNLMLHYARQTEIPEEVIVSLSQADRIAPELLDKLVHHSWPFKLVLIRNIQKTSVGKNRNLGTQRTTGDIVMYQDADDIPHPQRVEITKYIFKKYNIYHLMNFYVVPEKISHQFAHPPEFSRYTDLSKIVIRKLGRYVESSPQLPFHNGQPCVLRTVALQVQWPERFTVGEDIEYNQRIYQLFPDKTMLVEAYLILYRNQLTSGWPA